MSKILQKPYTFATLIAILQDFQRQEQASVSWYMFNRIKVENFKKENGRYIGDLDEKTAALNQLYVKKDDQGRPLVVMQPNGSGLLDFFDAEAKEAYQKSYFEFLNTQINLIF